MLAFPLNRLLFSMDPVFRFLSRESLNACECDSNRPLEFGVWTWGGPDVGEVVAYSGEYTRIVLSLTTVVY